MDIEASPYYQMVHNLFALPRLTGLSGRRERSDFLYRNNESGVPLLYRWHAGDSQLLTPGSESVYGAAVLHPSQPRVVYAQDQGGSEKYNIFRLDYESGQRQQITAAPIGRVGWLCWLADDRWLVAGGDDEAQYVRILTADGQMQTLFSSSRWLLSLDYDPDLNLLALSVGRGADKMNFDIALLDVAQGQIVHWISESDASRETHITVCQGKLAYTTTVNKSQQQVVLRSLPDGTELARLPVPGNVEDMHWLDDDTLAAIVGHHATLSPRLLSWRGGIWSESLDDTSAWTITVTQAGPIWTGSRLDQPNAINRYQAGRVEALVTLPDSGPYVAVENHWFPSFDGRQIQGWLLRHDNPQAPLVIYAHGGPTSVTGNMWRAQIQALALAGFHVFAPNFRGSTTFGTEFEELNIGDLGGGDMQDVLYGARYAAQLLGVRPKPAITGGSYGGFLTLFALTTQPEEWAGGVAVVPVADWVDDYYLLDASFRFYDEFFFGGSPTEKPELYRKRSPITHLARLKAPVLILHGENDSRCAIQPVIRFAEQAKEQGLPVEMIITRDEGHGSIINTNAIRDTVLTLAHLKTLFP
ncbi:MAG: hypothetical protein Fur0021_21290 [Candidatus Promineifilaceae bacterium]